VRALTLSVLPLGLLDPLLNSAPSDFGGPMFNNTLKNGAVILLMTNFDCNLDQYVVSCPILIGSHGD
jgi:hypothetical protein